MSTWRKIRPTELQAILTDVLPYELPIPFQTRLLHNFLTKIDFHWEEKKTFSIVKKRSNKGVITQLEILFDSCSSVKTAPGKVGSQKSQGQQKNRSYFEFQLEGTNPWRRHPYRFHVRKADGGLRHLSIPHPVSLISLAWFADRWKNSIIYYTNRSDFSVRHPIRVAALTSGSQVLSSSSPIAPVTEKDSVVETEGAGDPSVRSYFKYSSIDFIGKLFDSLEFRRAEMKFSFCFRTDIARCFDSIYTHSASWVINGIEPSKKFLKKTGETFGGKVDSLFQDINYGETSGIAVGPEASRVFAEIILQEVDVRVQRKLAEEGLLNDIDYSFFRYIDDYSIFADDKYVLIKIQEALTHELSIFKMTLNQLKTELVETPIQSGISIAKTMVKRSLKELRVVEIPTSHEVQIALEKNDPSIPQPNLYFPVSAAIKDIQHICRTNDTNSGQIIGYYFYRLLREGREVIRRIRSYKAAIEKFRLKTESPDKNKEIIKQHFSTQGLARYLFQLFEVGIYFYTFSPSYSNALKIIRLISESIAALDSLQATPLVRKRYKDEVVKALVAEVKRAQKRTYFESHTLCLIDALTFLGFRPDSQQILKLINESPGKGASRLDGMAILVLLRACKNYDSCSEGRSALIEASRNLIDKGAEDPTFSTERAILRNSIPHSPYLDEKEARDATGIPLKDIISIRKSRSSSLFDWNIDKHYYSRLLEKTEGRVY